MISQHGCGRGRVVTFAANRRLQFLPIVIVIAALLLAALAAPAASSAATYTFTPVADSYTRSDDAAANYGTANRMSARNYWRQLRHSYLRFNVALLPGEAVTSATLVLRAATAGSDVSLRDVSNDTWSETGLTWNSAPVFSMDIASTVAAVAKGKTASFDAGDLVTGAGLASMALTTTSKSAVSFRTRESSATYRPRLIVQTGLEAPDPGTPPPPPADTTAPETVITSAPETPTTATSANFSFTGADDSTAPGSLSFECSADGSAYAPCAPIKTYAPVDVGDHSFAVRAIDDAGNTDPTPAQESWSVTTPTNTTPTDTTPPNAPTGLTASAGDSQVALSWNAASDNVGVVGYRVFRDGTQVATPTGTAYTDAGRVNGASYSYIVKAVDSAGNLSGASNAVSATPQAPPTGGAPIGESLPARLPQSAGSTFYVSPSGSDSNAGTQAAPWRTVQKALSTLVAGQTALVRAGTYSQNVTLTRAGTATAPITIRAYPGETPILAAGTGATNNMPLQLGNGAAYARFQGLTFQGATGPSTTNVYAWGNAHDIEFSDCEVRNSQRQGFFSEKTTSRLQIIGCHFHDNGGTGPVQLDHNVYIQGSYSAVIGNLLTGAVNGYGVQVYPSSDHIIVAGNTITGNFRDGIIIGSDGSTTTSNALIVNNIITNSQAGISTYWGGSVGSGNVARNNLGWGNSQANFTGNGITYSSNLTGNPLYVNASAGDYRLQSASPALSIADVSYATPVDLDGLPRPLGGGPDLGAYER